MSKTGHRYEVQANAIAIAGFDDPQACKDFAAQLAKKNSGRRAFKAQAIDTTTGAPVP